MRAPIHGQRQADLSLTGRQYLTSSTFFPARPTRPGQYLCWNIDLRQYLTSSTFFPARPTRPGQYLCWNIDLRRQ